MKKSLFLIITGLILATASYANQFAGYTKLSFSGYKVNVVYSDTFRVEMKNNDFGYETTVKDGVFTYVALNQKFMQPAAEVTIYTNNLEYIELGNSTLQIDSALNIDTLQVRLSRSIGSINVNAKELYIKLDGDSSFSVSGTADKAYYKTHGGSILNAENMQAETALVYAKDFSNVIINAQNVRLSENDFATVNNQYEALYSYSK